MKHARMPLCLRNEGNGIFRIYFTAFDGNNPDNVETLWHYGFGNGDIIKFRLVNFFFLVF